MKKSILLSLVLLLLLAPAPAFSQMNYENGVYSGNYASSYSNGNQKASGRLENNQRVGNWEFYGENGMLVAKINYLSNTEFKTIETHNHLSNSLNVPLNESDKLFELPLEEKNMIWAKRVHRDISISEFNLAPDFNFFQHLKTIQTDKPLCFSDEQFILPIQSLDSVPNTDKVICGYRIKLDYFFRKDYNFMDFRIVGIAPLYLTSDGKTEEICWLYYHGLKNLVFDKIQTGTGESMKSILQTKNYHSIIYKESNVANKTIEEISKDEEERKKFYLEIDNSIIETENDLIIKSYF
jgi:hypothetical protein